MPDKEITIEEETLFKLIDERDELINKNNELKNKLATIKEKTEEYCSYGCCHSNCYRCNIDYIKDNLNDE